MAIRHHHDERARAGVTAGHVARPLNLKETTMIQARMNNPAEVLPEAMKILQALPAAACQGGVPPQTLGLVHLRASQINGCSYCVDGGVKHARKAGETDERLFAVSAWQEAPYFTDAERAALALSEAMTRLSDKSDPVPDAVWDAAKKHYDEKGLAALVLWIATTNLYNRINVATRQPAGKGW
jgi:AhpD family alkylhydroperoxidase